MGELDHRFAGSGPQLIVLAVTPSPAIPGVGSFHAPAEQDWSEPLGSFRRGSHLDSPVGATLLKPGVEGVVTVFVVAQDDLEARQRLLADSRQKLDCCRTVIDRGAGDDHGQEKPQSVGQNVTLAALDLLGSVESTLRATHLGGLDRLAIDARSAWRGLAPRRDAHTLTQGRQHPVQRPVIAPLREILVRRAFRLQVMRHHVPLAAAAHQVQDRVDHLAHVYLPRASTLLRHAVRPREQRLQKLPLGISQVRRVGLAYRRQLAHGGHPISQVIHQVSQKSAFYIKSGFRIAS